MSDRVPPVPAPPRTFILDVERERLPRPDPPLGRPPGTRPGVLGGQGALGHHHFTFVRFVVEGIDVREAWERCLAFSGGINDRRHFVRRLRDICAQIRVGAAGRQLENLAEVGLQGLEQHWQRTDVVPEGDQAAEGGNSSAPVANDTITPGVAAAVVSHLAEQLPTLDAWIDERCAAQGIDVDFQSQADWLAEYQAEFGLDAAASAEPWQATATAHAGSGGEAGQSGSAAAATHSHAVPDAPLAVLAWATLSERRAALQRLSDQLVQTAGLPDRTDAWLADSVCRPLRSVGIATLANLADYIDLNGHRWHRRVAGLGAVRAARLVAWLAPLVAELGRPLRDSSLQPAHVVALSRQHQLARLDPTRLQRFGLVPLERLAVPPELSGRQGLFRVPGANTLDNAEDDLAAIRAWLQRHARSPRTYRTYFHASEVFYLWCVSVCRKPLSSLVEADLHAFRAFLAAPPADWVQSRRTDRASDAWRPLRKPLNPISQRLIFAAIGSLYTALFDAGYVRAHPVGGVAPYLKLPRARIDARRSFTESQWACVLATLASLPNTAATRRTRLVLELGATTGMRLAEICTARHGDLRHELIDGALTWMLTFIGKGGREREAVIFDDVKAMLDAHQVDMAAAGIGFDLAAPLRTLKPPKDDETPSEPAAAVQALPDTKEADEPQEPRPDPALRPLVGALRRPVPRWRVDHLGVRTLNREVHQSDQYGAIEPSALYQGLKRLFDRAAERAESQDPPLDAKVFRKASTHWLRHFFANNAIDDGVAPAVLSKGLGHADLSTTSIYVNPERRALVAEMSKMRRRA